MPDPTAGSRPMRGCFAAAQKLAIKAAQDADSIDGTATFVLTAPGYAGADLAATEQDDDAPAGHGTGQ